MGNVVGEIEAALARAFVIPAEAGIRKAQSKHPQRATGKVHYAVRARHRLATREIEAPVQSPSSIAEMAVVDVADQRKEQMPLALAALKDFDPVQSAASRADDDKEVGGRNRCGRSDHARGSSRAGASSGGGIWTEWSRP